MKKIVTRKLYIILGLLLLFAGVFNLPKQNVYAAAAPVQIAAVEYYDENIVVFNNGNDKIYYATDAEAVTDKWECVNADPGKFTTIDISWLNPAQENVLMFKGDADDTKARVVIKKETSKLAVTINYSNLDNLDPNSNIAPIINIMTSEGTAQDPITYEDLEWRKGLNGQWSNFDSLKVSMLQKYLVRGTDLYFRIRAVDDSVTVTTAADGVIDFYQNRIDGISGGICNYESEPMSSFGVNYPDGTGGRRFSDGVRIKIVKKNASMVTGIDGEEFTAAIKYGKEYKVTLTYNNGTTGESNWIKVTNRGVKKIPLTTIANCVTSNDIDPVSGDPLVYNGTTVAFPAMNIQVRDYATSKLSSSKITEINLDAQRNLSKAIQEGQPDLTQNQTNDDIYLYYFGNKYILLTIPKATIDQPYEYCIVKPDDKFDLARASWSIVTKGTGIKVLANKAVDGATIYVRQKEIKSREETNSSPAVSYKLASTYQTLKINYPSIPVIKKDTLTYLKIENNTSLLQITATLNVSGKAKFEDTVKSVKLGALEIGFTTVTTTDATGVSTMTITLKNDELAKMANCTNRALTISFANGTIDKSSIKLTIKNPTPPGTLVVSAAPGTGAGITKVTVGASPATGNTFVYTIDAAPVTGLFTEIPLPSTGSYLAFTSPMTVDMTGKIGQYITVYEINADQNVIRFKSIQITSSMVGA